MTLRNAADVLKGTATVTSDPDGTWSTEIVNGGTRVEIDDHDKLHVTAGGLTADLVVPRITVLPDAAHDRVEIYSELPNTELELRWDSSPNQNNHDWAFGASTTTDGAGHASLDLAPQGGLDLGVTGNLYYYNADGQSIEPWWRAMVDAVSPGTLLNTADHTITITGVGFAGTPAVYLGKNGHTAGPTQECRAHWRYWNHIAGHRTGGHTGGNLRAARLQPGRAHRLSRRCLDDPRLADPAAADHEEPPVRQRRCLLPCSVSTARGIAGRMGESGRLTPVRPRHILR